LCFKLSYDAPAFCADDDGGYDRSVDDTHGDSACNAHARDDKHASDACEACTGDAHYDVWIPVED
jgi:hypothetical protein